MALLSTIRDLHRRKAREKRELALAEGVRLVEEMLAAGVTCKGVATSPVLEATPRGVALITALSVAGIPIEPVSEEELAEIATTEHPQGVVAVYQPRRWRLAELSTAPGAPTVVLDGVQDPGNVGTIARTALAFGAAGLIALPGTVDLTNPKVVRSAAGALFQLPSIALTDSELEKWLRAARAELWVTAMDGEPLIGVVEQQVALLLGNEGAGVRSIWNEVAARKVAIPIRAEAESLNVAVAAGILLHQLGRA